MAVGADVAVVVLSPVSGRARRVDGPRPTLEVWIEASFALEAERAMRPVPHPGFRPGSVATRDEAPAGFTLTALPTGTDMALLGGDGSPIAELGERDVLVLGSPPPSGGARVAGVRSSWPELIGAARVYSATAPPRAMSMVPVAVEADATSRLVRILWFGRHDVSGLSSVTVGVALEEAGRPYPWPPTLASAQGSGVASLEGTLVMSESPAPPIPDVPLDGTMAVRGKPPAAPVAPFALAPAGSNPGQAALTPGAPWSSATPLEPVPASRSFDGTVSLAEGNGADEVAAAQAKLEAMEAEEKRKAEAQRLAEEERKAREAAHEAEQKAKREEREAARQAFEAEQAEARRREAARAEAEAQAEQDRAKRLMKSVYGGFKK